MFEEKLSALIAENKRKAQKRLKSKIKRHGCTKAVISANYRFPPQSSAWIEAVNCAASALEKLSDCFPSHTNTQQHQSPNICQEAAETEIIHAVP